MGRWCDIPIDLLYEIDAELTYIEKIRVRATCVWWNSALPTYPNHKLPQIPWLFQTKVDDGGAKSHSLFNLRERKNYHLDIPHLEGKLIKGSSYGWLAIVSVNQDKTIPSSPDICLLNPLTGTQIQLPPRSTFPDVIHYIPDRVNKEYRVPSNVPEGYADYDSNHVHSNLTRQIVSSSSCAESCVVVAIYGEQSKLAWCMPGDKRWTLLDLYSKSSLVQLDDVLFSNNKLYAIDCRGRLFQVENIGLNPKVKKIITKSLPDKKLGYQMTIVECSDGRLVMVNMMVDDESLEFEAYEPDVQKKCWCLVNNIGNDMIFLGHNQTFALSSQHFPGYKGNCVYFTDDPLRFIYSQLDREKGDAKIGILNFEDGTIERLLGFPNVCRSLWPQVVWVTPPRYL